MNIITVMNFIRGSVNPNFTFEQLFNRAKDEMEVLDDYDFKRTYLVQYDVMCNERFLNLVKAHTNDKTEIGIWFEFSRPLIDAVGFPWRGRKGWDWDWHIIPGFSMAYTLDEREILVDEVMRKYKEIYGQYPKTVASWLLDTHTVNYIYNKYNVDTFAICRDQRNTDAYTLKGGYFNQAYYPSRYNMFCPATTAENQINAPVFRLLGACPIRNYYENKYPIEGFEHSFPYTLEPAWPAGQDPKIINWFFDTFFNNENLGFGYAQVGQENGFFFQDVIGGLRSQMEILKKRKNIEFLTMSEAGRWFKETYKETPATAVFADKDCVEKSDIQSVYYDCKNYTANLFHIDGKLYFRSMYLFDELFEDSYLKTACDSWTATYENLPMVETSASMEQTNDYGMIIRNGGKFDCRKTDEGVLTVISGDKKIIFSENKIIFINCSISYRLGKLPASVALDGNKLLYEYKGFKYSVNIDGEIKAVDGGFEISAIDGRIAICF